MANMSFTNNAATTLAGTLASGGTSLTVQTGTGSLFPTLAGSQYFYATLANVSGTVEIIKVTSRSTDTFTVTRGQDGTSAVGWSIGDKVELRLVAASLNDFPKLDEANTFTGANAYGTPASLVLTNATGLPVAGGGTGAATLAANNVLLGNGTGAFQVVAPSTSGNVLTSNGTTWTSTGSASIPGVFGQVFTSSGTFTVPAGVTAVKASVAGGSGAGGNGAVCIGFGGGGGGSGTAISFFTSLTPGSTITVTVGGVSGTSTLTSGTQTITTVSAGGGGTGGIATNPVGGAGGTASGGTQNIFGSQGASGSVLGAGGSGGAGGGAGGTIYGAVNGSSGGAGRVGNNGLSTPNTTGAVGQPGVVIFEW